MKRSVGWAVTDSGRVIVSRVAARNLRKRLVVVWSELRAACRPRHEPERIHQVRVACRRTLAAFEAFRELVPPKQGKWFEKRLRKIRRAAGETRDLDVLIGRLAEERLDAQAERAKRRLLVMLGQRRDESRQPLREVLQRLEAVDWSGRIERVVERVAEAEIDKSFADFARHGLRPTLRRFFSRADRRQADAEEIHRLRIEGKKLRYAMEIFAVAFPPAVRTACLKALEEMQQSLGQFTDHAAAADRFRRWARESGAGPDHKTLVGLRKREEALADRARKAFSKWWTRSRRLSLRESFSQTLERHAACPNTTARQ